MSEIAKRIYHLKGSPREVGFAFGQALGKRLGDNIDRYIQTGPAKYGFLDTNNLRNGSLPWLRSLPQRFQDEFEGMAEGANISLQRLAEWCFVEQCMNSGCTGLVYLLNSQAWVARNNDFWAPELWGYVSIREIEGRIPTISFGLEGDVFTVTGINQERLWLHSNYLPAWDEPTPERPYLAPYVWLTQALETCRSLSDVEGLLEEVDRDGGMTLFAVDGKTNEFAVFECMCTHHFQRALSEDWIVGTNHCCTVASDHELEDYRVKSVESKLRFKRVEELLRELWARGKTIDTSLELRHILADAKVEQRSERYDTVYSNVACPNQGEIWYTFGGYPAASAGNWHPLAWPW